MIILKLERTSKHAVLPTRAHDSDIGLDLSSVDDCELQPKTTTPVDTGWRIADFKIYGLKNAFMKIDQRSGLALKSIFPMGGIIDPGYRGQLKVLLYNGSNVPWKVSKHDRIGQLIFYDVTTLCEISETTDSSEFTSTDRNESGFGSTGK